MIFPKSAYRFKNASGSTAEAYPSRTRSEWKAVHTAITGWFASKSYTPLKGPIGALCIPAEPWLKPNSVEHRATGRDTGPYLRAILSDLLTRRPADGPEIARLQLFTVWFRP